MELITHDLYTGKRVSTEVYNYTERNKSNKHQLIHCSWEPSPLILFLSGLKWKRTSFPGEAVNAGCLMLDLVGIAEIEGGECRIVDAADEALETTDVFLSRSSASLSHESDFAVSLDKLFSLCTLEISEWKESSSGWWYALSNWQTASDSCCK